MTNAMDCKAGLRHQMLRRRRRQCDDGTRSDRVCARLDGLVQVSSAPCLAGYWAFGGEVDIRPLLRLAERRGQRLLLPRFDRASATYRMVCVGDLETELSPGHYGIMEPVAALPPAPVAVVDDPAMVWLVPGVAFGRDGSRLGRGGGHYDRLLAGVPGVCIGIGFDWQILDTVPHDEHDVPMDVVVGESMVIMLSVRTGISAATGHTERGDTHVH